MPARVLCMSSCADIEFRVSVRCAGVTWLRVLEVLAERVDCAWADGATVLSSRCIFLAFSWHFPGISLASRWHLTGTLPSGVMCIAIAQYSAATNNA